MTDNNSDNLTQEVHDNNSENNDLDQDDQLDQSQSQNDDIQFHTQNHKDKWYEVNRLLKTKGKRHYLVEWKDNSTPTWEPEQNITEALKIAFHASKARKRLNNK